MNGRGIYTRWRQDRTSAYGYKETSSRPKSKSALPPKADISATLADFRCCEGLSDACRGQVSAMNSSGWRRTSLMERRLAPKLAADVVGYIVRKR